MNKSAACIVSIIAAASMSVCAYADSSAALNVSYAQATETLDPADIEPEVVTEPEEDEDEDPEEDELDDDTVETTTAATEPAIVETSAAETTTTAAAAAAADTTPLPTYIQVQPYKMYVPESINVRRGPSTNFDVIAQMHIGTEVTVVGTNGDWVAVQLTGGGIGYIKASLLSSEAPAQATTTTTAAPPQTADDNVASVLPPDQVDTEPAVTEPPEVTSEETTTKKKAEKTTTTTKAPAPAASTDGGSGGLPPFIPAALCAIAAFLLVGALPILIHSIHRKNLYRY